MKRLLFLAGAIAAMASCTGGVEDINTTHTDAISFGAYVSQTTKGTVFNDAAIKISGFGLMTYSTGQNYWADSEVEDSEVEDSTIEFTPDFMYNQLVSYSNSAWGYSPIKFWPNETGDKLSFFAYAPYESTTNGVAGSYTTNTQTGRPKVKFDVQEKAINMIDFVAGQNMDMERQQDKVLFNLKHQLTRATFSAISNVDNTSFGATAAGDGASYIVIKSMDIVEDDDYTNLFYMSGIYTFDTETTDSSKTNHDQDGSWVVSSPAAYSLASILGDQDASFERDEDLVKAGYTTSGVVIPIAETTYTSLFMSNQYLFMLPPNGASGLSDEDGNIQIKIVYDIVTIDSALDAGHFAAESTYTITLPSGTLAQGKAYNFQLQFNVSEVLVNALVIDWDTNTTAEVGEVDPYETEEEEAEE